MHNDLMRFTREQMLEHMLAADPNANGEFITGVISTGIYCLPSCRARKPKPKNVVFYKNPETARAAGLRACKRCRPDDFYLGHDAGKSLAQQLLNLFQNDPRAYPNTSSLVLASGVASSTLYELFRKYFQATPGEVLVRERIWIVQKALLQDSSPIGQLAFEVGFENLSTFNANFRRLVGMSPSEYRRFHHQTLEKPLETA
jgi:AraC family transcriptional regulator, regulatory protein of adaptative response / DNA-3-methyladenine glycosylase II